MNSMEMWAVGIAVLAVVAFLFQIITIILAARSVQQAADQVDRQSRELEETLSRVQARLLEVSESLKPVREVAEDLAENLARVSETLQNRADQADSVIREVMEVGRDQAAKIDYLVSDTVEKFKETTETIQKDLLKPAIEISSFIRGIRGCIDAIFSRRGEIKEKSEEELFI